MKSQIVGASYELISPNAAADRCVNLYAEVIPNGGKEPIYLRKCPGLRPLADVGDGPIRGLWPFAGKMLVVSGNELYSLNSAYTATYVGVIPGLGPVSMADNGLQVMIAGSAGAVLYDGSAVVSVSNVGTFTSCGYLDGYFVLSEDDGKIWVSTLYDGTTIDALDYATAEGAPDGVVTIAIDHRELWIFGSGTTEVWYNSGATDYPLARISGAFVESGCTAARSVAKLDNALFWLGGDARGTGIVYRSNGYRGSRVSTHAIEWAIGTYGDVSDAVAFSYQQDGHSFYVITFPSVDKTWCYDASTNLWHERASLITGELKRYKANCMCLFNGNIVVGNGDTGDLYTLDNTFHMDGVDPLKWVRAWRAIPPGQNNMKRSAHHSLQIDVASGVGLVLGDGVDPTISLRWSDDGGHTWSKYHNRTIGKIGEYSARAIWHRLGMTTKLRDRVYEVSGTGVDPVPIAIMGAELSASPTNA